MVGAAYLEEEVASTMSGEGRGDILLDVMEPARVSHIDHRPLAMAIRDDRSPKAHWFIRAIWRDDGYDLVERQVGPVHFLRLLHRSQGGCWRMVEIWFQNHIALLNEVNLQGLSFAA